MTIDWCEIHKCQTNPYDDDQTQCLAATHVLGVTGDCQLVPLRLIPDDAANLIHGVLRMWNPDLNDYAIQKCAIEVVATLDGGSDG